MGSEANIFIEKLLQHVYDDQWSGRTNTACHCHPEWKASCPQCGVLRDVKNPDSEFNTLTGEHKPDCARRAIIEQASAYLRIENKLADEQGDDEYWNIP